MSIPGSGSPLLLATTAAAAADAGYVIPKSLRFNSGDSAHLSKTFASTGNRRTWTWSAWVKLDVASGAQNFFAAYNGSYAIDSFIQFYYDGSSDTFNVYQGSSLVWKSTEVLRDPAAWYHLVIAFDTTQSTADDRLKVYLNSKQLTRATGAGFSQNTEYAINNNIPHRIGTYSGSTEFFKGLMADIQFIDGQQLAPTDFGETRSSDGVWVPKEASFTSLNDGTTWSTNVSASTGSIAYASLGFDGNTTTAAYANSSASDTYIYVDFSPALSGTFKLWHGMSSGSPTAIVTHSGGSSTVSVSTGGASLGTYTSVSRIAINRGEAATHSFQAIAVDGLILVDNVGKYGKNGFHLNFSDSSTNEALGFDSAPTIPALDPKKGMDIVTYTGDGTSDRKIGGLNFEPGLVWIKRRNSTAKDHCLVDVVRGPKKRLRIESTAQETTEEVVTAFDPGGFTIGNDTGVNQSGAYNYVAWAWAAGGAAVSNTSGTINAEVSANTDYGFSIVKWTATNASGTIGHGLTNQTPKFILVKSTAAGTNWAVYHHSLGNTKGLNVNLSGTGSTAQDFWNNTSPTTSVFSVGSFANYQTAEHVAYVWSEVSGFSKFGTYEGTGSAGFAITTGFKPRFVIIKNADNTQNWRLYDTERDATSPSTSILFTNTNAAESTTAHPVRMLEDGFQIEGTHPDINTSGETYIYAAWADRPGNNWDVYNIATNEGLSTSRSQFDVVTYTGNGSATSIDSLAFQPDFLWIKQRDEDRSHGLYDSVRGPSKVLLSNSTSIELTSTARINTIDSAGFTTGSDVMTNKNGGDYVAWCWKAGGTAVSNTDGTITSSVSANAQYGFSIVSWTGTAANATIGHGLNTAPELVIIKNRDDSNNWLVLVKSLGGNKVLELNTTDAVATTTTPFNGTVPTSSVVHLGTNNGTNGSGDDMIAYCFADVPGYQRIGSYTGNGSTTGPVVVTGFKPRFIMFKKSSSASDTFGWYMIDSERDLNNTRDSFLYANGSGTENSNAGILDINADGFQIKNSSGNVNQSGETYVYIAIGDDEIGSDEDCLVDVPNAVTADAAATDTTGGYQRGNYCTLNPLYHGSTMSNGNLDYVSGAANISTVQAVGTIGVASGKWYWEATLTASSGSYTNTWFIGVVKSDFAEGTTIYNQSNNVLYYGENGNKYVNNSGSSYGASLTNGDVVGVALDLDNDSIVFYKNGVSQGSISYTFSGTYLPCISNGDDTSSVSATLNFGQMRFKYPMPSGYAALNTTALPAATIPDGSAYFDTLLWTGDNAVNRTFTGLEFSPDFVWHQARSIAWGSGLVDAVRGVGSGGPTLRTFNTSAEETVNNFGAVTALTSDGFTVSKGGFGSSQWAYVNQSSATYVAWAWDAGSSTVSNTDGSITSSVRANATAGFSIVSWTGTGSAGTIGHGLNSAPELIIGKNRGNSTSWMVGAAAANDWSKVMFLNTADGLTTNGNFNNTAPTSSVFSVGTGSGLNQNTYAHIAYCFSAVAGYSSFGSYEGNGSSDGPFAYTGFKIGWLMIKDADSSGAWIIWDIARQAYNVQGPYLLADQSVAESDADLVDILSNGFKIRTTTGSMNTSGITYLYFAFAENPFQANGGLAR